MNAKFNLRRSTDRQYYFNLQAKNGEVILASERYVAKASAENGIASVRSNSQILSRFEKKTSRAGEPYFVLTAANGQVIGKSEMYSSTAARDNGIAVVQRVAPSAVLNDETLRAGGAW